MRQEFEALESVDEKLGFIEDLFILAPVIVSEEGVRPELTQLVRRFIEDEDPSVREVGVVALEILDNQWMAPLGDFLIAMLADTPPKETLLKITYAMGYSKHEAFAPHLVRLLDHPDPETRIKVAGDLLGVSPEPARKFLASQMRDRELDLEWRAMAIQQFVDRVDRDRGGIPFMVEQVDAPEPELRRVAIESLDLFANPDAELIQVFVDALADEDPEVRGLATRGLGSGSGKAANAAKIAKLLTDPHPSARLNAAESLGAMRAVEHLPAIRKLLHDPDASVRKGAKRVVGLLERKRSERKNY